MVLIVVHLLSFLIIKKAYRRSDKQRSPCAVFGSYSRFIQRPLLPDHSHPKKHKPLPKPRFPEKPLINQKPTTSISVPVHDHGYREPRGRVLNLEYKPFGPDFLFKLQFNNRSDLLINRTSPTCLPVFSCRINSSVGSDID